MFFFFFLIYRDSLPPPPSPTTLYMNEPCRTIIRQVSSSSSSSEYKNSDVVRRQSSHKSSRPTSLYSNCEQEYSNIRQYGSADLNDNCTKSVEERLSMGNSADMEAVTEAEKHQIELFFRGLRSNLYVCSSLANLYVSWKGSEGNWTFKHTGVPVVILESGDTKSRSKRRIQILLAEKGTCFPLWRDTIGE